MFKSMLAATLLSTAVLLPVASEAEAGHRFRNFDLFQLFSNDEDFEDEIYAEDDGDEIVVPRRRDRRDWVYDPDTDEFVRRPQVKKRKPVIAKAKPAQSARRNLTDAEKRRIAAITGKPGVQQAVVTKPVIAKPVVKKPVVKAAVAPVAKPTVPSLSQPIKKPVRLVMPKEDSVSPKVPRLTPIPPAQNAISCDKAASIVSGFGFSAVSPQLCVGKTYAFKAMRDGKQFEVRVSSASGELTEVRKL